MSSEERWIKIENALKTSAEHLAKHAEAITKHDEAIQELDRLHKSLVVAVSKLGELHTATDVKLDKLHAATDAKLNRMIEGIDNLTRNIDRWIRSGGSNGHEG
jgi:hypothetical protein